MLHVTKITKHSEALQIQRTYDKSMIHFIKLAYLQHPVIIVYRRKLFTCRLVYRYVHYKFAHCSVSFQRTILKVWVKKKLGWKEKKGGNVYSYICRFWRWILPPYIVH